MRESHGTLDVAGCPLHYDLRGEGPPVVMIHEVGIHASGSDPQTKPLADRYTCLSFDNRGIGRSIPRGAALSVDRMARDTLALMDALGWESAHIVGHSLGGLVAQHLALTAPARVKSLALLCTFSRGKDATKMSVRMVWIGIRTRFGTRRSRRNAYLEIVMPPDVLARGGLDQLAEEVGSVIGHDLADHPSITMQQLSAMRAYDATSRLCELAGVPTLALSAAHGVTMQHADRVTAILAAHFGTAG